MLMAYLGHPPSHYAARLEVSEYRALSEKLQKHNSKQAQELKELQDEVSVLSACKDSLAAKYKQLKTANEHLQHGVKEREKMEARAARSLLLSTHLVLGMAALSLRWLASSGSNSSEHRLMAGLICWPLLALYLVWIYNAFKAGTSTALLSKVLMAISTAILGYVAHAAVELHMEAVGVLHRTCPSAHVYTHM